MKFNRLFLPTVILLLSYGFWLSADFTTIATGVAIFLFGMLALEQGFHAFSGGTLERILRSSTDKLWKSLGFGMVSTIVMQSSSLVSLITISSLSAGIMDLTAGVGIIFGSNLGRTSGAWLIAAFGLSADLAAYAMPLLVIGILLVFQNSKHLKGLGYALSGIGFLLLGIHYMKTGFSIFTQGFDFSGYTLPGVQGLLLFTSIGIIATVIMQSSHATLMIIIAALSFRQISYDNALALTIGANIGTTITAVLGSMSTNVQGKRLAAAHFLFNAVAAVIALLLIKQLILFIDKISPWLHIRPSDYTLKLAAFHTLFNLLGIVVMTPFIGVLVAFLQRVFKEEIATADQPRYLDESAMDFPEVATELVRLETLHLYLNATHIMLRVLGLPKKMVFSDDDLAAVIAEYPGVPEYDIDSAYERNIKGIYSAIVAFISRSRFSREQEKAGGLYWMREATRNIVEALKSTKHLQKNLYRMLALRINRNALQQYNIIRLQLACFLRELENIRLEAESGEPALLTLDKLRASMEKEDRNMNQTIDALIRERKVTPEIGTSLINDNAYMYEIKHCLLTMAQAIFVVHHEEATEAQRQLSLSDAELHEVVNAAADNPPR